MYPLVLFARSLTGIYGHVKGMLLPQAEEQTELRRASLDNQLAEPSPEIVHESPDGPANAPRDSPRSFANPKNGQHEGRSISRTTAHKHEGGDLTLSHSHHSRSKNLEDAYKRLAEKYKSLEHQHRQLSDVHQSAVTEFHESQNTYKKQQQEISSLRERLRGTSVLLDVRNEELKVAKAFLSKEDPFSTSEVVQSVRDLNSEIMQTATHLADNLALKRVRNHSAWNIPEGPLKSIFVTLVLPQGPGEDVDMGLLELALQGFLAVWIYWVVNAWGFCEASGWCDELYSKVCETEDPTVARNWRALTRRTLFNIDSSRDSTPFQVVNNVIEQLAFHLYSCGVGEASENTLKIGKYAADKLKSLFVTARKLSKMIGENVVSDDLAVTIIGAGHLFNCEHMEDAYPWDRAKPGQRVVICTTDLGLCERKGAREEKVLLKPKVVL